MLCDGVLSFLANLFQSFNADHSFRQSVVAVMLFWSSLLGFSSNASAILND